MQKAEFAEVAHLFRNTKKGFEILIITWHGSWILETKVKNTFALKMCS